MMVKKCKKCGHVAGFSSSTAKLAPENDKCPACGGKMVVEVAG